MTIHPLFHLRARACTLVSLQTLKEHGPVQLRSMKRPMSRPVKKTGPSLWSCVTSLWHCCNLGPHSTSPPPTTTATAASLNAVSLLLGLRIRSFYSHVTRPLNQNKPEQVLHCFPGASGSPRNSSFVWMREIRSILLSLKRKRMPVDHCSEPCSVIC